MLVKTIRLAASLSVAFAFVTVAAPQALADPPTLWVNASNGPGVPPGTSCDHPSYQHIQDAVNAALPGTRINVCPGTYTEQVSVPAGKDNINLVSVRLWQAIIQAPALMVPTRAIVHVLGAHGVGLIGFTVTGPLGPGCDDEGFGVRVDNGSANILGNHITRIQDSPFAAFGGCQDGVAVQVGRQSEGSSGSANIFGNVIDNYQKNGMTVSGTGSSAHIVANRVTGIGPTNQIAENGIQVSDNATAQISYNLVADNIYSPQTVSSTGILLFTSGVVTADHNTLAANDVGDYMFNSAPNSRTTNSTVRASTFDGVAVDTDSSNSVVNNSIMQNGGPGVGMYGGSSNNHVDSNDIDHNAFNCTGNPTQCAEAGGILLESTNATLAVTGNTVDRNHLHNNGTSNSLDNTDGIRVNALSTSNTLESNFASGNVTHDCHDDSHGAGSDGTANYWISDVGQTSQPAGLCHASSDSQGGDDSGTRAQIDSAAGWDPAYAWYASDPIASQYDWPAAYSSVDTQGLLQLPAALAVGVRHAPSPAE